MKQYIPTPQSNRTKKIATALFAVSLAVFLISGWPSLAYRSVVQAVAFAIMAAALMIAVRFLLKSYCYRVEKCGDGYEFVVLELSKNRSVVVCRLSMAALLAVEPWSKELAKEKKKQKELKIYNYCAEIAPSDACLLSFSDSTYSPSGTPICVKIQCDADFRDTLASFLEK